MEVKPTQTAVIAETAATRADWIALTKPRISLMVTLTGAVGYLMASLPHVQIVGLLHTVFGIALVSGAANTLNQVLERTPDAQMRRTANRPLAAGRIRPEQAAVFAAALGTTGVVWCAWFLNPLTALLAAATLGSYAFVYTPLKRKTPFNTLVGAVPGALPPLGGWTAATGAVGAGGLALFSIVFLWQVPHFLAIAWILKEEYARAGFRMLPVVDESGRRTGRHMIVTSLLLIPASGVPTWLGLTGQVYAAGAVVLSLATLALSLAMAKNPNLKNGRRVFFFSLIYLPAILILMMADKAV